MEKQVFDAVETGQYERVRYFLFKGVDVNMKSVAIKNTLLHVAIKSSHLEIVKLLIDHGANVNLRNKRSQSPMSFVMNCENFRTAEKMGIMRMLMKAGADPNAVSDHSGETALHFAASNYDADLVRLLVRQGALVNKKDNVGTTPLHAAALRCNSENPAVFEILLSAGAKVNETSGCGKTALHYLGYYAKLVSLSRIVEVFVRYNADFYATTRDYWGYYYTPMDVAVCNSCAEAVKAFVIVAGVNINIKYRFEIGTSILHKACELGDASTVRFLLKMGASINEYDTPLFLKIISRKNLMRSQVLYEIVLEHLTKLYAIERPIDPSIVDSLSELERFQDYLDMCYDELDVAKVNKIHPDSWVTLFHLLVGDDRKLVGYAGNPDLMESLEDADFEGCFPIYSDIFNTRISDAIKNRIIWEQAANKLSDLLPIDVDPTHRVTVNILSYMSMFDLEEFVNFV